MSTHPGGRRRRWWRRVAYVATASVLLLSVAAISAAVERSSARRGMFADVATPAMAAVQARSEGACWADYDGDGDADLFVTNSEGPVHLWRNDGAEGFRDVAAEAGLTTGVLHISSCAFLDMDNDGRLDLFLGGKHNFPQAPSGNKLFRHLGNGRFEDITPPGLKLPGLALGSPDWADMDNDGDYDGFASVRFGGGARKRRNAFFEQVAPFSFRNIAPATGLDNPEGPQSTWVASWFDYDGDGDLDLLLGLDFWGIELFRNDAGRFTRVTLTAFPPASDRTPGAPPNNPMGVAWGDVDNDGCIDLWVSGTDLPGQGGFGTDTLGDLASRLYRNKCDGTFEDITLAAGFTPTGTVQWGANFVDFDNDGDLDLSVVAGNDSEYTGPQQKRWKLRAQLELARVVSVLRHMVAFFLPDPARRAEWAYRYEVMVPAIGAGGMAAAMPNFLYQNQFIETGVLRFVNANNLLAPPDLGSTLGSAWADMDGDGDLDWFVPNRRTPSRLYRNDGPVGRYLRVHLVGRRLRDAVGAWVKIRAGGQWQIRHVHILDGQLSQSQMDPHFGLGQHTHVDEVWVRWPGQTQWRLACTAVPANSVITVREGDACRR